MNNEEGIIKKITSTILELIYPEKGICFICDKYSEKVGQDHICQDCKNELKFINKGCIICGKPLEKDSKINKCYSCLIQPHYFSKTISVVEYKGIIKKAIYKFKYGKKPYMSKAFGALILDRLLENDIDEHDIDIIVPVPLHRIKLIKRGFNQAEVLGKYISNVLDIPLSVNNLVRKNRTSRQNKLDKLERQKNIEGAFKVRKKELFKDMSILLVDDIFTTGATVDECSKILLNAGAKEIKVLCIATGRNI